MNVLKQVMQFTNNLDTTQQGYDLAKNQLEEVLVMMASGPIEVQAAAYCLTQYEIASYEQNLTMLNRPNSPFRTMATDGISLFFNPHFVSGLYHNHNIREIATILCHELAHMMLFHTPVLIRAITNVKRRGNQLAEPLMCRMSNLLFDVLADEFSDIQTEEEERTESFLSGDFAQDHKKQVVEQYDQLIQEVVAVIKIGAEMQGKPLPASFDKDMAYHIETLMINAKGMDRSNTLQSLVWHYTYLWENIVQPYKDEIGTAQGEGDEQGEGVGGSIGKDGGDNHVQIPEKLIEFFSFTITI